MQMTFLDKWIRFHRGLVRPKLSQQRNLSASSLADSEGTAAPWGRAYKGIPGDYSIAGSIWVQIGVS